MSASLRTLANRIDENRQRTTSLESNSGNPGSCMYVCMYVCVCMCIYIYIYISTHMHACMHACIHACMYVFMYLCMCVYTYIYIYIYILGNALHEKGLQRQTGVDLLVSSQERRALFVPVINRLSIAGQPVISFLHFLHRSSFVRVSGDTFKERFCDAFL